MAEYMFGTAVRNAVVDAVSAYLDGGSGAGTIALYSAPQLSTAATAITSQTLVATLTFSADSFPAASSGTASAAEILPDLNVAGGTPIQALIKRADGVVVMVVDVGVPGSGAAIEINGDDDLSGNVVLTAGGIVRITALALSAPDAYTVA